MDNERELFPGFSGVILPNGLFLIEGYEPPPNFPNCCPFHTSLFKTANEWFEKFPDCCEPHSEMAAKGLIKKSDYEGLPRKILAYLSFTEHHISKRIDLLNWYEDITDYIIHIQLGAGLGIGVDRYLKYLKLYLENTGLEIPDFKRKRLIQYIEGYFNPSDTFGLSTLVEIYRKWKKIFPFEMTHLTGSKENIGKISIAKKPTRMNHYVGWSQTELISKTELIDFLNALTKRLLDEVETDKILNEGKILDINKHLFELAAKTLRIENVKILKDYSEGELQYITTIGKWLEAQETFLKKIVDMGRSHAKKLPAPNARAERKKPLPTLENALQEPDKLPGLWQRLSKMKNPLVSESGQFILQGRQHAVLLAFAQAMKSQDKLQEKIGTDDAYYILCARFNVPPAKSLRQVRRGKRDLMEHFEAFNDVLREG